MMRSNQAPYVDERQTSGATDFDAALEAFLAGGDREVLLRAAAIVIHCELPLSREHADGVEGFHRLGAHSAKVRRGASKSIRYR